VTDSSRTIIECLVKEAKGAGVRLFRRKGIEGARRSEAGGFELDANGAAIRCDRLLLATGGCRAPSGAHIAESLGHSIAPAVPSLFSFHVSRAWLHSLPGVSVPDVEASVQGTRLRERGPLLITHNGVSGPVILRLSAWGARILHEMNYQFVIRVNWLPELNEEEIRAELQSLRQLHPKRRVMNSPLGSLPVRLWEQLVLAAGVDPAMLWTTLSSAAANALVRWLRGTDLQVNGKSLNKEEFVTCGGVSLREVNFKTMESRITPNLYFAGELLDLDGITGGFNFQAAWTTGWIAGNAMADVKLTTRS
jgi:predicted Rossmann fold flavoprotein